MINLDELFASEPTATLIEPRNSDSRYLRSLRLLLRDNATGALTELTIEADMVTLPEEALLVLSVMDVDEPVTRHDHGEYVDNNCPLCGHNGTMIDGDGICWTPIQVERSDEPQPCGCRCALNVTTEAEPNFGWRVAIDGTETDTRAVVNGLF